MSHHLSLSQRYIQSLFESSLLDLMKLLANYLQLMIQSSFPIALEIARTIEATIPNVAAGSTTLVATSNLVAPSP